MGTNYFYTNSTIESQLCRVGLKKKYVEETKFRV